MQAQVSKRLFLALLVSLMAAMILPGSSRAQDQCPAYSHPVSESNNVVHCKCNDGLVSYGGRCQNKAAVEDQLQQRTLQALKGIRSTTDAIEAERSGLVYARLRDHFRKIDASIGAALLVQNPAVLAPEALDISADLGATLGQWGDCSATPDLRAECDNLHNFQRILDDTATQLMKVEQR